METVIQTFLRTLIGLLAINMFPSLHKSKEEKSYEKYLPCHTPLKGCPINDNSQNGLTLNFKDKGPTCYHA